MKCLSRLLTLLFLIACGLTIQAQNAIPATGGTASGSGGSVSYTIGQVASQALEGTTGSIAQGVQQPYEISVVTAIGKTEGIVLDYKVYPNPTHGSLRLTIEPFDDGNFRFWLYDLNGILLQDKKVISEETEISLENLNPALYFLKILKDNREVKVFKIIKK